MKTKLKKQRGLDSSQKALSVVQQATGIRSLVTKGKIAHGYIEGFTKGKA